MVLSFLLVFWEGIGGCEGGGSFYFLFALNDILHVVFELFIAVSA